MQRAMLKDKPVIPMQHITTMLRAKQLGESTSGRILIVNIICSAEDFNRNMCRCQQHYTMPKVSRLLCREEPECIVASRRDNNSLRLIISLNLRPPQFYFSARNRPPDVFFGYDFNAV
jgi:hypothetical protein